MKLKNSQRILGAEPAWHGKRANYGDREVSSCHASDLISDILSFCGATSLLLTGLTNVQVVRTAETPENLGGYE